MKTQSQVVLALLGVAQARLSEGQCQDVAAFQNVDAQRLEGNWYPVYADTQDLAQFDASCFKAKISLAQNWWERQMWQEEGDQNDQSDDDSDSDDSDSSSGDDEAGADENEENAETNAENASNAAAKKAKKAAKAANAGADLPDGTERFFNSAHQINQGGVTGFLWTVDLQTNGDAVGKGYFMGKQVGQGQIIDTDYDNYVITQSCQQVEGQDNVKQEKWGLCVRDQNLSAEEIQKIWEKANEYLQKANAANAAAQNADAADADANADAADADANADAADADANADAADADANEADAANAANQQEISARQQYDLSKDWSAVKQGDDECEYYEW